MNKLIFVAIGILIISGAFVFTQTDLIPGSGNELKSFSTDTYFNTLNEYSFVNFYGMECQYVNEMYVKYQGEATFGNVAFDSSPVFNPQIQFDLTDRNDGRLIDQIRIDMNQKCTAQPSFLAGGGAITATGKALFQLGSGDLGDDLGNFVTGLESVALNKQIKSGEWTVIASKTYPNFQQYESKMILHNGVNAWLKAFGTIDVVYKFTYSDSTNNFVAGSTDAVGSLLTTSAWLVRADANVITPPVANANTSNEPIFLTDVRTTLTKSQGGQDGTLSSTNPLDTNKQSGRQIVVEGTVRKWLSTEGQPSVKITDATGRSLVSGTMLLDQKSGDDGLFVFYYSMPFQSDNGAYVVTMTHPNRFQGDFKTLQTSTRTIIVENTNIVPVSTTGSDGSTITNTSTGAILSSYFGNVCLAWTALYTTGESQNGLICDETFDTKLGALSLANSVDGVNKLLKSVQVTPILQFKDATTTSKFTIESSDIVFDTSIDIAGTIVKLDTRNTVLFSPTKALCVDTEQGTTCANEGFSLGSVILGTDALTNKIETNDKIVALPKGGTAKVTVKVDISGGFTARNNENGKAYSGKTDGSVFNWDTTYIKGSLGQQIVTVTDADGKVSATTTTDDTTAGAENPEKELIAGSDLPEVPASVGNQGCGFNGDTFYFVDDTCDDLELFFAEVRALKDGTCHSKDFPDSDGITREVIACSSLDQTIGTGGASGNGGGGLAGDNGSPGGLGGFGVVCEGTILQCAEAFTAGIDDKLKDRIGLDSVEIGIILFVVIIIVITLGAVIHRRRNNY